MVKICNITYLRAHGQGPNTSSFAITRTIKSYVRGCQHLPALAPTQSLFFQYCRWRDAGKWNQATFNNEYVPRFLRDFSMSYEAQQALHRIKELDLIGETVLLGCYCQDETICHRSIIAGLLYDLHVHVETDTGSNYAFYADILRYMRAQ